MKKQIYVNGRFLTQPLTGTQRYARELLKAVDVQINKKVEIGEKEFSITILAPRGIVNPIQLKNIETKTVGCFKGNLWEQISLLWHARNGVLFSPCNTGPFLHRNQVVTLHDVSVFSVPDSYSLPFRFKYSFLMRVFAKSAKAIITVSQFSKNEISRVLGINPEKIIVTHLGGEHVLEIPSDENVFSKFHIGQKPYVLAVGSNGPHKNLSRLIAAYQTFKDPDFDLVIAGGTFMKIFPFPISHFTSAIKYIGYVTDGELRSLYEHAACYVFPSLYEGFGLPPLEAMTLGCPTAVSNTASMPEICGDAVDYFDPLNVHDIAQKVVRAATEVEHNSELRLRGLERAKTFSWRYTACTTYQLLGDLLQL